MKIYTYDYQHSVLWSRQDCYTHELMKLELQAQDLEKGKNSQHSIIELKEVHEPFLLRIYGQFMVLLEECP